jgi:nucleotide-binding universal stress UspA family protein
MFDEVVVVGVDGSPASYTALRWALAHAGNTGSRVHAIRCWQPMSRWEAAFTAEPVPSVAEQQAWAERELEQVVAAAVLRVPTGAQRVAVRCKVVRGRAGQILIAEAGEATLLVVGSRDQRRLVDLAHGSVSGYCTRHAPCPVVVIPPAIGVRGMPPGSLGDSARSVTVPTVAGAGAEIGSLGRRCWSSSWQ